MSGFDIPTIVTVPQDFEAVEMDHPTSISDDAVPSQSLCEQRDGPQELCATTASVSVATFPPNEDRNDAATTTTSSSSVATNDIIVTPQDLQAMRLMVRDIHLSPDLFLEHSPVYVRDALSKVKDEVLPIARQQDSIAASSSSSVSTSLSGEDDNNYAMDDAATASSSVATSDIIVTPKDLRVMKLLVHDIHPSLDNSSSDEDDNSDAMTDTATTTSSSSVATTDVMQMVPDIHLSPDLFLAHSPVHVGDALSSAKGHALSSAKGHALPTHLTQPVTLTSSWCPSDTSSYNNFQKDTKMTTPLQPPMNLYCRAPIAGSDEKEQRETNGPSPTKKKFRRRPISQGQAAPSNHGLGRRRTIPRSVIGGLPPPPFQRNRPSL